MRITPVSSIVSAALKRRYVNMQYIKEAGEKRSEEAAEIMRAINQFQGIHIDIII